MCFTIVLSSEIMNLKDLECFVNFPGPYPVSKLKMKYQNIKSQKKQDEF